MISKIFKYIQNLIRSEDSHIVDNSLGQISIEEIISKANAIALEKFFDIREKGNIKNEIRLTQHKSSKRLIWFIYSYYTQEDWQKENLHIPRMRFALIKIDDESGKVLFADFINHLMTE